MHGFVRAPRPVEVSVIGAILWAYALFSLVGVAMAVISASAFTAADPGLPPEMKQSLQQMSHLNWLLLALRLGSCLLVVAVTTAFLNLRTWGMVAVQALLCLLAAGLIAVDVRLLTHLSARPTDSKTMGVLLALIILGLVTVPLFGLMAIRKPEVRAAFTAAEAARHAGKGEVLTG